MQNQKEIFENADSILKELFDNHEKTGECGIYEITENMKLGEKLVDFNNN